MSDRPSQTSRSPVQPVSITLNDVYYILFRQKWVILSFSIVAILAAGILYLTFPTHYVSEAKLLVRYVTETRSLAPSERNPDVKSPDSRGETIINSELEILTSMDLAKEVAEKIGTGARAIRAAENGKPSTGVAVYAALLWVYGLLSPFTQLADPQSAFPA